MAAKLDKQTLIKHHFWILLALAVVLIPVALGGVWVGVAGATAAQTKKIDDTKKKLTSTPAKSKQSAEELDKQLEVLNKRKSEVWKEAYEKQKGLFVWPKALSRLNDLYFGDPISTSDRNRFRSDEVYRAEYEALPKLITPTEFAGGWWSVLLNWKSEWKVVPSDEDVWLALEDICVYREILTCVADANMMLARFEMKDEKKDKALADELTKTLKPQAGEVVRRFVSPYWQLDLAVARPEQGKPEYVFRGNLKNVSGRRQNVSRIDLKVWLTDPARSNIEPAKVPIDADYLGVGETAAFKAKPVVSSAPRPGLFAVEQQLDQKYVPVKVVSRLILGYPSMRTANIPLKQNKFSSDAADAVAKETGAPAGGAATPTGGGATDTPSSDAGGAAATSVSPAGLVRPRYIEVNEQVRRMPIGLVLVVDQAHVQDVMVAFANSRLRFQITQAQVRRFHGVLPPPTTTTTPPPGSTPSGGEAPSGDDRPGTPRGGIPPRMPGYPGGGFPGGGFPGGMNPGNIPPGMLSRFPALRGAFPGAPPSANPGEPQFMDEATANLVELGVYGIASLYQRYPPKAPPADASAAAPATTPETSTPPTPPTPPATPPAETPVPPAPPAGAPPTPSAPPPPPAPSPPRR
jgi:hypothetical protein